jgi:SAM-dependent methyltransferase
LDVSLGNLIIAKNRSSVLSLVRGDAEHLPFRQAVFGAILIVDLLHHIPDPHIVIKEVAGIIVNGGTLFMWDACANGIMPIYPLAILAQQCSWKIGLMIEHLGPDLNDIIMWLAESGFTILNVIGEGTFIRFIGSLLDSFCKRLKIPLPFTITKFLSSIDQKATRLFKKFPIKFGIVAIKQF